MEPGSSGQLLEKKDLISIYRGALARRFVNMLVYLNKYVNNFKPLDSFFTFEILEIGRFYAREVKVV